MCNASVTGEDINHFVVYRVRDWSLITGGGATKLEIRGSQTFCAPPLKTVKLYTLPPYNIMAKNSSYRVENAPKVFVPPF